IASALPSAPPPEPAGSAPPHASAADTSAAGHAASPTPGTARNDSASSRARGGPALYPAPDSVTVEQCVALARLRAPEVRSAAVDREVARLDSAATSYNRRPSFSIFGGATVAPPGFYDPVITNLGESQLKAGVAWP